MIKYLTCLLLAPALTAQARPNPAEALTAKLASPFLKQAPWLLDYDAALKTAAKHQKLVLGYFTTANY